VNRLKAVASKIFNYLFPLTLVLELSMHFMKRAKSFISGFTFD
jgi:hypothetical protein